MSKEVELGLQSEQPAEACTLLKQPDRADDKTPPGAVPGAKFDFWKLSFAEKTKYVRSNITVEPMLACYIMASVVASLATQNLNLEKACRVNLAYSDEVCTALANRDTANYTREEQEVQQLAAGMAGWKTFVQSSLPVFLILFVGSWSDRHGRRRPCMLVPIVGEFITSIGLILCTYFFYELPMEAAGLVESVFPAMTGGWFTMFMAVFSYIADVTDEDTRTLRIGIVNVFFSMGIPIGMALSGVLYKQIGFYGVFSLSTCMYVFSFFYGYYMIKEEPKRNVESCKGADESSGGVCAFLRDFFDLQHVKETFWVAFRGGKNNRRTRVLLLMLVVMMVIGPMHGEMTVMYLFTRLRFNWDEVDFSIFSTYSVLANLLGTMLSVGLFSYVLKVDDALIGIISCVSKILGGFVYAAANTTWMLYLAPIVDAMNGTSFIAMRSIASKLVPSDELGKVNSMFGVCEAMMPLMCGPLYSAVYQATMHTLPGAFFLLGGAITAPAVFIFAWMYRISRREMKERANAQEAAKPLAS